MVFSGALQKQPNGTCGGTPTDVIVDAVKRRQVACPAGTTARELPTTDSKRRVLRCVPEVIDQTCTAGNPTAPGSGAKLETSIDYQGAGAHPLVFERKYNSRIFSTAVDNPFSATAPWSHNYARTVQPQGVPNANGSVMAQLVLVSSSVDQRMLYRLQSSGAWLADNPGNRNTLTELKDTAGVRTGWEHKLWADDTVETYNIDGVLLSIKQRNGWTTTLTYSDAATPVANYLKGSTTGVPGLLIAVKNRFGRELKFTYEAIVINGLPQTRLKELLPPGAISGSGAGLAQSPIVYGYEEATSLGTYTTKQGQLTSVTWQDGTVRRYHYAPESSDLSHHLTGITDEAGVRIGTYTYLNGYYVGYQNHGKVGSTEKAGGADKLVFSYSAGVVGYGNSTTTITDYTGPNNSATTRSYSIQVKGGIARPTAVTAPCPTCGSTQQSTLYGDGTTANGGAGANGQPIKTVAHDGTVTFYTYDAKGRETEKATFPASYAGNATKPALASATTVISTQWHGTFNLPTKRAEPNRTTAYTYANANATTGLGAGNLTGQSETQTTDATGAAKFTATQIAGTPVKSIGKSYTSTGLVATEVIKTDGVVESNTAYTYDASGQTNKMVDRSITPNETVLLKLYDQHGRLLESLDEVSSTVKLTYDVRGNPKQMQRDSYVVNYTFDTVSRFREARASDGGILTWEYDVNSKLTKVTSNGYVQPASTAKQVSALTSSKTIAASATASSALSIAAPVPGRSFAGRVLAPALGGGLRGSIGGPVGIILGVGIGVALNNCQATPQDRCERECDAQYDRDRDFCRAISGMRGRNKAVFKNCMDKADEAYIQCYQDCKGY
jgi:YD repeat-containing protein